MFTVEDIKEINLLQAQNEGLKKQNESLQRENKQLLEQKNSVMRKNIVLFSTLQEIKEIAENCKSSLYGYDQEKYLEQILQKIAECEVEG